MLRNESRAVVMAAAVETGRYTAVPDRETVTVFLIGMRANRWWKVLPVVRTAAAMPRMLRHLAGDPEAGLLGYHQWLGRTTILLSYWKSPDHLQRFAADTDAPHLGAWRQFTQQSAGSGDVGIWHETYQVKAADQESIYTDMPAFGLGAATRRAPVGRGTHTARQRLGRPAGAPRTR
ncbi:DUF4188 domain-containing protein [Arthrobacter sp.]|uniref:DUF4188 domain-containing protein n=1 Tax=Arthrobacter sp. TaxID=1667 RepID=UPI003A8CBF50